MLNRYAKAPKPVYSHLLELVQDKDYFVLTTNVDHQFQLAGFDKKRLFYTQGTMACGNAPSPAIRKPTIMRKPSAGWAAEQKDMRVPSDLCPTVRIAEGP